MKKIYIFAAVLALLTLSLNAQMTKATQKVAQAQQTSSTKKADMPFEGPKMFYSPTSNRAPLRATENVTDHITASALAATSTTYTNFSGVSFTSDAVYAGQSALNNGTNIQLRATNPSGIVTTASGGKVKSITITVASGTNTIRVYGKNTAYTSAADLYSNSSTTQGTLLGSTTSTGTITVTGDYAYIGIRVQRNSAYLSSIDVVWEKEVEDPNIASMTVCDGQYYAQYLPVYGYYHDEAQHNQMVYPASMLGTAMIGKPIKSMTFYPTSGSVTWSNGTTESASGINFRNGTVCFKLANIPSGSGGFDAGNPSFVNATLTEVKTVSMPSTANTSATTWKITFDQDFTYTGGDLLIDVTNPTTGTWGLTFFTVDDTGDNYYGYLTSGGGNAALNFLPKVTFSYDNSQIIHDLGITLEAQPTSVGAGGEVTLTATVTNNGGYEETGYTVTFYANGTAIGTQNGSSLAIGGSQTFTTTYTTTDAQGGTNVNFTAVVTCTDDIAAANNEAAASTSVVILPPPENVAATTNGTNATVTWDPPIIDPVPITLLWDFEESTDLPEFTTIDSDGDGYNWGWHYNTGSGNYTVHQGSGVAYSESFHNNDDGQTGVVLTPDNWMISPEVTLGGTLKFWAAHLGSYPENFAVYVCQGPYSDVSSFTKVYGDITTTSTMTEHTIDLSQYSGQGYFAIRHYNVTDQFVLVIDDITYPGLVPGQQPTSYNIYLDGVLVGSVNANNPLTYDFSNLADGQHTAAISAVYPLGESVLVPTTFIISNQAQTAPPVITVSEPDANGNVTVTATGNGTVNLSTSDGQTASGNGSASITLTPHMQDYTVTATATAQVAGELVSNPTTQNVTVPGINTGDWIEMDGTYDHPYDLLSFEKNGEGIMLIDQFLASTLHNDHPDHYTYTLREIVNREEKISSPVNIPVYKTNSKMNGFYTKGQVDTADLKMGLKAQVINSEMCNDVDPDHNTLYHSLYRGDKNAAYPVIDVQHRVSQLQKYEDMVDGNVHYFFTETHTSGITPRYDNIGRQIVERLDTNYVQGVTNDELSYVPVIWTFGLYSGREDGKNNSYGSDIKREKLGGVSATIAGEKSDYSDYGKWTYNGVEYCVYTPEITIEGMPPLTKTDNDGDVSTYVPYMYRAWCLYEGAHDFVRNSDGQLIDNGVLTAPILLDEKVSTQTGEYLGGPWTPGMARLPWAFGIPVSEDGDNVTFAIRFYYKKVVTEAGQGEPNSLRDGDEEYYIVECEGDAQGISTAINELFNGRVPVETIYYNSVGMQSSEPFDGINIVVTRYSDGTSTTTKVVR